MNDQTVCGLGSSALVAAEEESSGACIASSPLLQGLEWVSSKTTRRSKNSISSAVDIVGGQAIQSVCSPVHQNSPPLTPGKITRHPGSAAALTPGLQSPMKTLLSGPEFLISDDSECSTRRPSFSSAASSCSSVTKRDKGKTSAKGKTGAGSACASPCRGSGSAPWGGSFLADVLEAVDHSQKDARVQTTALPPGAIRAAARAMARNGGLLEPCSTVEIVGTYPSGEQAQIISVDQEEARYKVQMLRNGRIRTIKAENARPI